MPPLAPSDQQLDIRVRLLAGVQIRCDVCRRRRTRPVMPGGTSEATDATLPASGAGDIYCQAAGIDAHAHSAFLSCFNRPSPVQQLVDDEHLNRRDCRELDAGVQEVIL